MQDGEIFYLENNTFIRHTVNGLKIYKTRNNHPDGPDSEQTLVPYEQAAALTNFISAGIVAQASDDRHSFTTDASDITLDEDLEDDDEDENDDDGTAAVINTGETLITSNIGTPMEKNPQVKNLAKIISDKLTKKTKPAGKGNKPAGKVATKRSTSVRAGK